MNIFHIYSIIDFIKNGVHTANDLYTKSRKKMRVMCTNSTIKIQHLLLSYMYQNWIIVICNDVYLMNKFLCNFIDLKPRSAHPKNSGKSVTTAPPFERFSPKVN